MELSKALSLINNPALNPGRISTWADLGCGDGFFTNALSTFLAKGSTIYAVDNNISSLKRVTVAASIHLKTFKLDFVKDDLPFGKLDGIMMANSLHYVKHKEAFLEKIKHYLADRGKLLIIEYDTTKSNPWVPYPVKFSALAALCIAQGFADVVKLAEVPSAFRRGNMYSALAILQ